MRTFCQSVNLDVSICNLHAVRLPQVGLGHRLGYEQMSTGDQSGRWGAYLGVLELLLDVAHETAADLADEGTIQ